MLYGWVSHQSVLHQGHIHFITSETYCTISTECSWGVTCDLWCSRYQVFIVVCDVWWLWKCSWKHEVFTDFLICTISSLIEECDECVCLRLMSCSSDWRWVGERNMPLGAAKNFLIDSKATFSNSQKMSSLNSWLAQGKSWANIPPPRNHWRWRQGFRQHSWANTRTSSEVIVPNVHVRFSLARANGRTGRTIEMIQLYWDVLLIQKSAWGQKKSHLLYSFYQVFTSCCDLWQYCKCSVQNHLWCVTWTLGRNGTVVDRSRTVQHVVWLG